MPTRPNVENASVPLMREAEIFIAGYPMPLVSEIVGDLQVSDDTFDAFGLDEQLYFRTLDGATLRVTAANAREQQNFLDVLTDQKPDSSVLKAYAPKPNVYVDVVRQFRTPEHDGYNAVEFWGRWNPMLRPTPAGGPRERGSYPVDGRAEAPVRVVSQPGTYIAVLFDAIQVAGTTSGTGQLVQGVGAAGLPGTATNALFAIPASGNYRNGGKYAFAVELQSRKTDGTLLRVARIPVPPATAAGAGSLTSAGLLTVTAKELLGTGFSAFTATPGTNTDPSVITHAYVTYLVKLSSAQKTAAGVSLILTGDKATGLPYDGRFD